MVHWDRKRFRIILLLQFLGLFSLTSLLLWFLGDENQVLSNVPELKILHRSRIPISEMSGLSKKPGNGNFGFVAVGDRDASIVSGNLFEPDFWQSSSFGPTLVSNFSLCLSTTHNSCEKFLRHLLTDWEAIAVDGNHRHFLVQEHSESILILNSDFTQVEQVIHVQYTDAFAKIVKNSTKKFRANALGEGIVLLKNGHILLAKEKYPPALIEFGPEGHEPIGFSASTMLSEGEAFQIQSPDKRIRYRALHYWSRGGHSKCDISEMAASPQGKLYVLSQNCGQILEFQELSRSNHELKSAVALNLPKEIKNPEAMIAWDNDTFLIGSDRKDKGQNLFLLERPDRAMSFKLPSVNHLPVAKGYQF